MKTLTLTLTLALSLPAVAFADGKPGELFLDGKEGKLQTFLWRPDGAGPFPAIVYNHGSEQQPTSATGSEIGPFFVAHGFVVLFPIRRGAGKSAGRWWRDRAAAAKSFQSGAIDALVEENDDVATAVAWLRAQPFVDGKRVAVAGCSFGGIQTLLAAERPLGLAAAVDFAGGAMAWADNPPLRERLLAAAERARVPVFFVQAENDFDVTPTRVLAEAMRKRGLPHRARIFPPHGKSHPDGHAGFCNHGTAEWGADVLDFLRATR